MTHDRSPTSPASRRELLKCMAYGTAGTLFTLAGGVLTPVALADAADRLPGAAATGRPLFVQISDTHIGFAKEANPDVNGTLLHAIDLVNALPEQPGMILHTGDITHLSKPAEFDVAQALLGKFRATELHSVPGEHDTTDPAATEYFSRFGKASGNRGYYSFDHSGVHFIALVNVLEFRPGGLGNLGADQLAWVTADLRGRSASTPIVVFAHMPLWTIHEPWGWGTGDAGELMGLLRRFGSVTVLNGHIHQIVRKVEGNVTFHTARSTAFPQPVAGEGTGPGPLKVPPAQLPSLLGFTSVTLARHPWSVQLTDAVLAAPADAALAAPADSARVLIQDFSFAPDNLSVRSGTTVTWTNRDQEAHTIVSDDGRFRSAALDTDDSFTYRFDRPGSYRFACSLHPQMVGTITVA